MGRRRDELLSTAFTDAPTGLAVVGPENTTTAVNLRLARMLGVAPADLVGRPLAAVLEADDDAAIFDLHTMPPATSRDLGRRRCRRPDGSVVWAGITMSRSQDGSTAVVNFSDLTGLIRAEERLGELVEGLDDGVLRINDDLRVVQANPAATRLFRDLCDELVGVDLRQPPWEVVTEQGRPLPLDDRPIAETLATGAPTLATLGFRRGGTERWMKVAAYRIGSGAGRHWVAMSCHDVTDQHIVERELRKTRAADQAKSEFLSRMSHELRTPLNAVLGFAQLLALRNLEPTDHGSVEQILGAGRHLLGLLDEVLDLERMAHGNLEIRKEPVDLVVAVTEAVEIVRPLAAMSAVAVDQFQSDGMTNTHVLADPQRLRQILINLLENTIKFNHAGGRVQIESTIGDGGAEIRVQDTGPGIDPDLQWRLFTPFERLGAEARGVSGAGIGLALSRKLADAMHAEVRLEASSAAGTTFVLSVPFSEGTDATSTGERNSVEPALPSTPRRVLYIEDNAQSRSVVARLADLTSHLTVTTAASGTEGVEQAFATRPDAILLDLNLPDIAGEDVLGVLHRDAATARTPVIVLSADADPVRRERMIAAGAAAYLTKPVDLRELLTALDSTSPQTE